MDEYKKKTNTGDDVFVRIQPQSEKATVPTSPVPTAVVLGWLASKPRHVTKYTALYERMGYNTVQTTAPFSIVFPFTQRPVAIYFLSILRILASDDRLTEGGIVFQMFSNGGAGNAPFLSNFFHIDNLPCSIQEQPITDIDPRTTEQPTTTSPSSKMTVSSDFFNFVKTDDLIVISKIKKVHAAVIFDSGPVKLRIHLGYRAINEGLGINGTFLAYIVACLFTCLCLFQRLFISNYFWNGVRNASYVCPEMYIYSHMDHLLDIPALEALIEERKQKGCDIRVFDVEDAPHVSIFRNYPKKYNDVIQSVNEWGINEWRRRNSIQLWTIPEHSGTEEGK